MSDGPLSIAAHARARACVNARRVLANGWTGEYGRGWAGDLMGLHPSTITSVQEKFRVDIAELNAKTLTQATLYVADSDMVALLDEAAPTMPDQPLHETDLLSDHGFVWFAAPLPDRSTDPTPLTYRAISWTLVGPDHPLLDDHDDGKKPTTTATVFIHTYSETLLLGQMKNPGATVALTPGTPGLIPTSSTAWTMGTLMGEVFGEVPEDPALTPMFFQRVLAAFWALAVQPLTRTVETSPGDRNLQKRAARSGVLRPYEDVRVVQLKHATGSSRAAEDPNDDTKRRVGVRFPTRGFWRNQWMPSTQTHRHIYIAPHWRGPAGAPIQGGERVFLASGKGSGAPGSLG